MAWWNASWPTIQTTIRRFGRRCRRQSGRRWRYPDCCADGDRGVIAWWNAAWPPIQAVVVAVWGGIRRRSRRRQGLLGPSVSRLVKDGRRGRWRARGHYRAVQGAVGFARAAVPGAGAGGTGGGAGDCGGAGVLEPAFMAVVGVVVGVVQGIANASQPLITTVMTVVQSVIGIFTVYYVFHGDVEHDCWSVYGAIASLFSRDAAVGVAIWLSESGWWWGRRERLEHGD